MFATGRGITYTDPQMLVTTVQAGEIASPSASVIESRFQSSSHQPFLQLPQWGEDETRDLIEIRGEVEREDAAPAKGNVGKNKRTVWETVSWFMKERGHVRTPEQCKCKWKNLLQRYKGKETSSSLSALSCPFFEELHSLFAERSKTMQRELLESETAYSYPSRKRKPRQEEAFSSQEGYAIDDESSTKALISMHENRKGERNVIQPSSVNEQTDTLQELFKELLQHQHRMDILWVERMERHANEVELFEQEWRQSMVKLHRERFMMEMEWREREEGRKIRAECRAERRDAIFASLLSQLIHEK